MKMEKIVIKALKRGIKGKQVRQVRRDAKLPGVIYGRHIEASIPIVMDLRNASKALHGISSSSIVTIDVDGKEYPSLVREKQRDYLRNVLLHVDFQAVSLTEKIRADVEVIVTGLSPAVKDFNGMVVLNINSIEVDALPQHLPERIRLDITGLKRIGDSIHVKDIKLSDEVTVHNNPEDIVVVITAAGATEEVAAPVEGAAVLAEPEVIEKGKKEEEIED